MCGREANIEVEFLTEYYRSYLAPFFLLHAFILTRVLSKLE